MLYNRPLLASKTPSGAVNSSWLLMDFVALAGARAYIAGVWQCFSAPGEVRFAARWSCLPTAASILDRNGLILASSVPAASIWAIPEDVEDKPVVRPNCASPVSCWVCPRLDLQKKLSDEDKTFVWVPYKAPVGLGYGSEIAASSTSRVSTSAKIQAPVP